MTLSIMPPRPVTEVSGQEAAPPGPEKPGGKYCWRKRMEDVKTNRIKGRKFHMTSAWSTFFVWVVICIIMAVLSPYFLSVKNFLSIAQYSAITGALAVGMTIVIVGGGIDISVGSVVTLVGMVLAAIMPASGSVPLMVLVAIAIGVACGLVNGLLVTRLNIVPFVVTLGTMEIFKGLAFLTTRGVNTPFSNLDFAVIGRGYSFGQIPNSFIIMICMIVIGAFLLKMTPFGKKIFAVGSNATASKLAGINVKKIKLSTYIICGACAAIAGLISTSQNSAGLTNSGDGAELNAIAGAVLGGASLAGGSGSMVGTLIGVLLLNTITNGLNLLGVSSYWQLVAQGAILVFAVIVDSFKHKA